MIPNLSFWIFFLIFFFLCTVLFLIICPTADLQYSLLSIWPYALANCIINVCEWKKQKYLYSEAPILKHMNFRQKILQVSVLLGCDCK